MQDNVTQAVDSGMDAETVATAELLWANLPTGRKWTSLRTDEVALVCHTVRRLASTTAQAEAVQKLVEALEALVGETLGGDLSRDDENQVTPRGSYQAWISWSDRWAARDALAAHRESQP